MAINCWYFRYALEPRHPFGTYTRPGLRYGALLRVEFADGLCGFADCHPWPELGDLELRAQLDSLFSTAPTTLIQRSLHFARIDAEARAAQRNIFEGLLIPENHAWLSSSGDIEAEIVSVLQQNYRFAKMKLPGDVDSAEKLMRRVLRVAEMRNLSFRFDLNAQLSYEQWGQLWNRVCDVSAQIDFIEDPFPIAARNADPAELPGAHVIAWDRGAHVVQALPPVVVIKPACVVWDEIALACAQQQQRLIFTSNLDHPLGQMCAAYEAARCYQQYPQLRDVCGLQSHMAYTPNPFSDRLNAHGPRLFPVEGAGFGFDDLLESLTWKKWHDS